MIAKKTAGTAAVKRKNSAEAVLSGSVSIIYGDTIAGFLTDTDQRSRLYPDPGTWGNTGNPADVFSFSGEVGDTVMINIDNPSGSRQPNVYLFQGQTKVAEIEEYDPTTITYVLEATSYEIEVVSRQAGDGITTNYAYPYTLKVVRLGGPPSEAAPISIGSRVYGAFTTYDARSQEKDEYSQSSSYRNHFADFFTFSGSAGDTIVIQLYNPSETYEIAWTLTGPGGSLVPALRMDTDTYYAFKSSIDLLYDDPANPYYRYYNWIVYPLTADGTYHLEVRSGSAYYFYSGGIGPYVLEIARAEVPFTNTYLGYGGEADGSLDSGDRTGSRGHYSDYHTFFAEEGDSVLIELHSDEFDTFMYLSGPDNSAVVNTEDQSASRYCWIGQRVREKGAYTVEVTSYNQLTSGSYSLSINFITEAAGFEKQDDGGNGTGTVDSYEPNDEWNVAYGPIASGQVYEGYIETSDDVDWFYLVLDQAGFITVDLTSLPDDYDIQLFDEESEDNIGSSELYGLENEKIEVAGLPAGKYWVAVYTFSGFSTTDSYRLTATYGAGTVEPGNGGSDGTNPTYNPGAGAGELYFKSEEFSSEVVMVPAVGPDGTVYLGTRRYYHDSLLVAVNPDGTVKWKSTVVPVDIATATVLSPGGMLFTGADDSTLYAVSALDGSLAWKYKLGGGFRYCAPALGADGTVYLGADDGNLYAVNPQGTLKWALAGDEGDHFGQSTPAVGGDGTVYAVSFQGTFYALDPDDGAMKWKHDFGYHTPGFFSLGGDGRLYFNGGYGVIALDMATGSETLIYSLGTLIWDPDFVNSPAIGEDGTLYIGADNDKLYAIDPVSGSVKWEYQAEGDPNTPAVGADGTIYFTAYDDLYALNPDGSLKWMNETDVGWTPTAPTISEDGIIFFGGARWLYAVASGTGTGLADSPWPKFAHDIYNSGRSGTATDTSGGPSSLEDIRYVRRFEGTWDAGSSWGTMVLRADGTTLSGSYTHDQGRLAATLSTDGITMTGTWSESPSYQGPNDAGPVIFTLSDDGNSFSGYWQYGESTPDQGWGATRLDYYLNGLVKTGDGRGLDDVSVNVSGNGVDTTVTTDSYGYYHLAFLANGTYTVTPSKSGYSFSSSTLEAVISDVGTSLQNLTASSITGTPENIRYVKKFEGTWDAGTNWGTMVLRADSTTLSGSYTHDQGRLEAAISGDGITMNGTWSESPTYQGPNDAGPVIFTLSEDGNNFSGYWQYGENTPDQGWGATRLDYYLNGLVKTGDDGGLGGVTVLVSGDGVDTTLVTDSDGFYHLAFLANGAYTATPSLSGHSFDPSSLQASIFNSNVTLQDIADGSPDEEPDRVGCDFNQDGRILISDVIAMLLFMRENPGDLRADFNGDGKAIISDAIAMLLAIRDGSCPDALVLLSSVAGDGYLQAGRIDGLSGEEIHYLEGLMSSLGLTPGEEAAFRVALDGVASAAELPRAFSLAQNTPNPFNPSTTVSFDVPAGPPVKVRLAVYDIRGSLVRTLVDEARDPGTYSVFWDGTDDRGGRVSSGVYFYRLQAGEFVRTRKMVLLK